jgi:hypothetical protein
MTTDVSAALATLQLHPEDSQALKALAALHLETVPASTRTSCPKALSDARRFHRERGDYELVVSLIDLELAVDDGRPAPAPTCCTRRAACSPTSCCATRPGEKCVREALDAQPGHAAATESLAQMSLVRAELGADLEAYLQQARGRRIRRSRPASTDRSPSSISSTARDGEGETFLRAAWSWIRTTGARATTSSGCCARRATTRSC